MTSENILSIIFPIAALIVVILVVQSVFVYRVYTTALDRVLPIIKVEKKNEEN